MTIEPIPIDTTKEDEEVEAARAEEEAKADREAERADLRKQINDAVGAPLSRDKVNRWPKPVAPLLSLNGDAAGLYPGEVAFLVGAGGVGKSYLALRIALALTARKDRVAIHASQGRLETARTGRALLVSAEDGDAVNYARIRALIPEGDLGELHTLDASEMVGAQLVTVDRVSLPAPEYGESARASRTIVRGTAFLDTLRDSLTTLRKEGHGFDLVIFDPLSRLAPYEAETDNGAAAALLKNLQHFARETGAAVLVLHHQNKGARKDKDSGATSARGSSALVDGARTVLALDERGLSFAKVSHHPEPNRKEPVSIGDLFGAMTPKNKGASEAEKARYK